MAGKYSNFDPLPPIKYVLRTKTDRGYIIIEKFERVIIATDQDNKEVCKSYILNESGLRWVKKECRGWGGWSRLKWEVIEKQ